MRGSPAQNSSMVRAAQQHTGRGFWSRAYRRGLKSEFPWVPRWHPCDNRERGNISCRDSVCCANDPRPPAYSSTVPPSVDRGLGNAGSPLVFVVEQPQNRGPAKVRGAADLEGNGAEGPDRDLLVLESDLSYSTTPKTRPLSRTLASA